jgi:hypothetical protein
MVPEGAPVGQLRRCGVKATCKGVAVAFWQLTATSRRRLREWGDPPEPDNGKNMSGYRPTEHYLPRREHTLLSDVSLLSKWTVKR